MKFVSIIGAGTMGLGIAQVFLQSNYKVEIVDINKEVLKSSKEKINNIFKKLVRKEKILETDRIRFINNLDLYLKIDSNNNANLIIESVNEDLDLKKALIGKIENIVFKTTIIASNTSSISINKIAEEMRNPERMVGLHFFNPVPLINLVEIIKGKKTSKEVIKTVVTTIRGIKKEPVIVKDSPGFIVNRLLIPMINEAINMSSNEIARSMS